MGSGEHLLSVSRAVREALRDVAHEVVADDLLYEAMVDAGVSLLPEDPEGLGAFVEGHLTAAIEAELGAEAARRARRRLSTALQVAQKAPPRAEPAASSSLAPSRGTSIRTGTPDRYEVLVVSAEERVAGWLGARLATVARLVAYPDLDSLVRAEPSLSAARVRAAVVDCRRGALEVARPAPLAFPGTPFVLWFARPRDRDLLATTLPRARCVAVCDRSVLPDDVALLARMALGEGVSLRGPA